VDLRGVLRYFATVTCNSFKTKELPRERAARLHRAAANGPTPASSEGGPKSKGFNLSTYKLHALGGYPKTILERGTTNNYTTGRVGDGTPYITMHPADPRPLQVENEHRWPKKAYQTSTNKHLPERDIGRVDWRHEVLRYLARVNEGSAPTPNPTSGPDHSNPGDDEYWMSEGLNDGLNLQGFLTVPHGALPDPAKMVHIPSPNVPLYNIVHLPHSTRASYGNSRTISCDGH